MMGSGLTKEAQNECVFCYENMLPGDRICQLACHPKHKFHEACYDSFSTHFEANGYPFLCPLCRAPVDKSKVTRHVMAKPGAALTAAEENEKAMAYEMSLMNNAKHMGVNDAL